jgi:hypothetical protein
LPEKQFRHQPGKKRPPVAAKMVLTRAAKLSEWQAARSARLQPQGREHQPPHQRHEEIGRFQALRGKTWNHPALVRGRLYVRNAEEIACYELAGE